jgi:hypothetical protein
MKPGHRLLHPSGIQALDQCPEFGRVRLRDTAHAINLRQNCRTVIVPDDHGGTDGIGNLPGELADDVEPNGIPQEENAGAELARTQVKECPTGPTAWRSQLRAGHGFSLPKFNGPDCSKQFPQR